MKSNSRIDRWLGNQFLLMAKSPHYTSLATGLWFFAIELVRSAVETKSLIGVAAALPVGAMLFFGTFVMCELFIVFIAFRSDLDDAKKRLPQAVVKEAGDKIADIAGRAAASIGAREQAVQTSIDNLVERSVHVAAPHLKLAFETTASDWLSLFATLPASAEEGVRRAADRVNPAPRAISCNVLALRVEEYADVAETLLGEARTSVQSTTYYPNRELVRLFTQPSSDKSKDEDKRQVQDWIKKVNKWANDHQSGRVHRIHLFDSDSDSLDCGNDKRAQKCLHLQSAEQFIEILRGEPDANTFYVTHYAIRPDPTRRLLFDTWQIPSKQPATIGKKRLLPPECIIVDEEVALMYDPRFGQLKMFFGAIAQEMSACFADPDRQFTAAGSVQKYLGEVWGK